MDEDIGSPSYADVGIFEKYAASVKKESCYCDISLFFLYKSIFLHCEDEH